MKFSRFAVAFALALSATVLPSASHAEPADTTVEKAAGVVRVMSWNIRYHTLADGLDAWPLRRDELAELIRTNSVDLLGLQEVLPSQLNDLTERLPAFSWVGVGRDDGKRQGEFVPIFYRTNRFEVHDQGAFWLSEKPDEPGRRDWGAGCPRVTTWIRLRDKQSGQTLIMFNTHFDHASGQAREKSVGVLQQQIARHAGSPLVLTGDFNCTSDSTPYRLLTAPDDENAATALADAHDVCEQAHEGPDSTWNGFRDIQPGRRIDFIFIRNVTVARHEILDARRAGGRFLSDHLPVLVDVRW